MTIATPVEYEQIPDDREDDRMGLDTEALDDFRREMHSHVRRIDENFLTVDSAIGELRKIKPRRAARTGAAARVNPDDIRLFRVALGLNVVFAAAALTASFSGQYAMARYTAMPQELWWIVPLFIDVPLVYSSLNAATYKRRGQSTIIPWATMGVLAALSSAINIIHVLSAANFIITIEVIVGATVMGAAPLLLLIGWEEVIRLAVKPATAQERAENTGKPTPKKGTKK